MEFQDNFDIASFVFDTSGSEFCDQTEQSGEAAVGGDPSDEDIEQFLSQLQSGSEFTDIIEEVLQCEATPASLDFSSASSPSESSSEPSEEDTATTASARCPVCGDSAGKHLYYGARVCVGCRGFFRRSVQSNHYPLFACSTGDRCRIVPKARTACKSCRFRKCLASGMKTAWVLSDQERRQRIVAKNNNNINQSRALVRNQELIFIFTEEESRKILSIHEGLFSSSNERYFEEFKRDQTFFKDFLSCLFDGQFCDNVAYMAKLDEDITKNFLFGIPEMSSLCFDDRVRLVIKNNDILQGVLWNAIFTDEDAGWYFRELIAFGQQRRQDPVIDDLVRDMENRLCIAKPTWNLDKSVPACHLGEFKGLMGRMLNWFREDERNCADKVKMTLFMLVAVFNPDMLPLTERAKVERLQEHYLFQLYRYLKAKKGRRAAKLLHDGLNVMSVAKRLYDIQGMIIFGRAPDGNKMIIC